MYMSQVWKNSEKLIFDYVIIGTGPAGAVIAKTLTDNKKTSVLVLEAGRNNDKDESIRDFQPAGFFFIIYNMVCLV
jgi:choline dehydrogenase